MVLHRVRVPTPVGSLVALVGPAGLVSLGWEDGEGSAAPVPPEILRRFGDVDVVDAPDPLDLAARLGAWVAGDLPALDALPVDPAGTSFQREVWVALRAIPAGEVRTYAQVAAAVGRPGAARAVGGANRANPVAVVIPCHRVVAADGTLGGYAGEWAGRGQGGEGLARKAWLLRHEGVAVAPDGRVRGAR